VYEIKNELHKFSGSQKQFDDIALISIRRKLTPDLLQHAICREASMDLLSEMCDFVEASTAQSILVHDEDLAFRLAAEEICKNIIQHGFEGMKPGQISLSFEKDPRNARLIIRDNGRHFHPDQAQNPDLAADWQERKIGGLGIHLVKELMDDISYQEMDGGGNQLTLEKKINNQKEKESDQWNFKPNK
jgi:serine/threonine-protein kinase RsbW